MRLLLVPCLALAVLGGRAHAAAGDPPQLAQVQAELHAAEAKRKELQMKLRFAENQVKRDGELAPIANARAEAEDKQAWAMAFEPEIVQGRERLDALKQTHKELVTAKLQNDSELTVLKTKRDELKKQLQELEKQVQEREKALQADPAVANAGDAVKAGEEQLKERTAANPKVKAAVEEQERAKKSYDEAYQAKLKAHPGAKAITGELGDLDRVLGNLREKLKAYQQKAK